MSKPNLQPTEAGYFPSIMLTGNYSSLLKCTSCVFLTNVLLKSKYILSLAFPQSIKDFSDEKEISLLILQMTQKLARLANSIAVDRGQNQGTLQRL